MLDLQTPDTKELIPQPQALQAFFDALQKYPDFVDGLDTGRLAYREIWGYEEAPFTADTIHQEIAESLSQKAYKGLLEDLKCHDHHMKVPYFFLLGFVLGEVAESFQA